MKYTYQVKFFIKSIDFISFTEHILRNDSSDFKNMF